MKTSNDYYYELIMISKLSDKEISHPMADDLLCEIAISASKGEITKLDCRLLVSVYKKIEKWYA